MTEEKNFSAGDTSLVLDITREHETMIGKVDISLIQKKKRR